jgi:glycogen phosphorylase
LTSKNGVADPPSLPKNLEPLRALSKNAYWSWNRRIERVFEQADPELWNLCSQNPVALVRHLPDSRLQFLSKDEKFLSELMVAEDYHNEYMRNAQRCWFSKTYGGDVRKDLVAYFSAEFGITNSLRTYSGGLGILSGDHLKSASDLCIPLVGIGLFYRKGYFSQSLSHDGWQVESYPENDPNLLGLEAVLDQKSYEPLMLKVPLADREVSVRVWRASIGRVYLYLLDTNFPQVNSPADCEITSELYGGDGDLRIRQEIILGFGGVLLLNSLGLYPTVYHMNEGHSAFASLQRIRNVMEENSDISLSDALKKIRNSNLFTTHTPVAAGIDVFSRDHVQTYLGFLEKELRTSFNEIFSLGQENPSSDWFNMAVLAIRTSRDVNAVSKLHRHVATKLWNPVLRHEGLESTKMSSVTNGVHVLSWISDSMADLYEEYLGSGWEDRIQEPETWRRVSEIPEGLLWKIRCRQRELLVQFARERFRHDQGTLDPNALTIGFARRFATYKRATLLFSDLARLEKLVLDPERPVQFVFAGKAHPKDQGGKKLIQEIVNFSKKESVKGKIVFLADYDISTARHLVQGVDLWLNNPRRPMEASGTSGMKVLANGGLNISVLDGWWDEAYSPSTGWMIGGGLEQADPQEHDKVDAESLYSTLERNVIPDFYERTEGIPLRWVSKMKNSMRALTPVFSSSRMLMEYAQRFYFRDLKLEAESTSED